MDFSFDDDHLALRDAVRRFCEAEHPAQQRGDPLAPARAAELWAAMTSLGLPGLRVDAALGGSGQGAVEAMLVAQELGRVLGGGPWLGCTALAGGMIADAGDAEQCRRWLAPMAAGTLQLALACDEPDARYDPFDVQVRAVRSADGWRLDGRKQLVWHGDSADVLLVVARSGGARRDADGLSVFAVDAGAAGLAVQGFDTLDGRRAAHLSLDGVQVADDRRIGPAGMAAALIEAALDRALALLVAEATGAIDALVMLLREHLRTRRQFGAPLARFQVLQHRIADIAIGVEQARSMACAAAMAVDAGEPRQRARHVSAAKAFVGPLGQQVGLAAIQLFGAMGMTDECRVGHYAKRLMVINQSLGDASWHQRRFARHAAPSTLQETVR